MFMSLISEKLLIGILIVIAGGLGLTFILGLLGRLKRWWGTRQDKSMKALYEIEIEKAKEKAATVERNKNLKASQAEIKKQKLAIKNNVGRLPIPFAPSITRGRYYCIQCFILGKIGLDNSIGPKKSEKINGFFNLSCNKCPANADVSKDVIINS